MERNLYMRKRRPSTLTRSCVKKTGPRPPLHLMKNAITGKTGTTKVRKKRMDEPTMKSIPRFSMLFQPWSGVSFRLMMGMPSMSSRAAFMVAYWTRSGTTLMSRHSRDEVANEPHHARVLLERQGHIHLVGPLGLGHTLERRPDVRARAAPCVQRAGAVSDTKPITR